MSDLYQKVEIIKDLTIFRSIFRTNMHLKLKKGDVLTLINATNLADHQNLYWIVAVNDDWEVSNSICGHLFDTEQYKSHFAPNEIVSYNTTEQNKQHSTKGETK